MYKGRFIQSQYQVFLQNDSQTCLTEFEESQDYPDHSSGLPMHLIAGNSIVEAEYDNPSPGRLPMAQNDDYFDENSARDMIKIDSQIQKPRRKVARQFTKKEDMKILQLVLSIGPKFTKIGRHFTKKTVSMVKNRYYKYLRFRWDEVMGIEYKHLNASLERHDEMQEKLQELHDSFANTQMDSDVHNIMSNFLEKLSNCLE